MKKSSQYMLPVDLQPSRSASEIVSKGGSVGKPVSLTTFSAMQKDKRTHEIAKRYVEYYKIFG